MRTLKARMLAVVTCGLLACGTLAPMEAAAEQPAANRQAQGAPLAERIPGDALVYVGWRGAADVGPGFDESHLKALLDHANITALTEQVIPGLIEAIMAQEGAAVGAHGTGPVKQIFSAAWNHPTAFYFGGMHPNNDHAAPQPRIAVLWQAGEHAERFHATLARMLEDAPNVPPEADVYREDDLVVLAIGHLGESHLATMGIGEGEPAEPLAAHEAFLTGLERTLPSPIAAVHVNIEGLLDQLEQVATQDAVMLEELMLEEMDIDQGPGEAGGMPEQWGNGREDFKQMKQVLGLDGLKHATLAMGFDGREWGTRGFLKAPAPRRGLTALMDHEPLPQAIYDAIPASAIAAGVGQLDLAQMLEEVRRGLREFDPAAEEDLDEALAMAVQQFGIDPVEGLLEALGPAWALYRDGNIGGEGAFSMVAVNHLRHPDRLKQTLDRLIPLANQMLQQHGDPDVKLRIRTETVDGTEISYLAFPLVSPAWAIHDGNLYLSLFPEMTAAAAHHVASGAESIGEQATFADLMEQLEADDAKGFYYADTERILTRIYPGLVAGSRTLLGAADIFDVDQVPATVLPPLYRIRAHMAPAAMFTWSDEDGFYLRAVEPVPGSALLGSAEGGVVASPLIAGILLPALENTRQAARATQSMANLRQIGVAAMAYTWDHHGRMPPDFGVLVEANYIHADAFFSPDHQRPVPEGLEGRQFSQWLERHASYVYMAAGIRIDGVKRPSQYVLAYERPEHSPEPGTIAVAFLDGHVRRMPVGEAERLIEQQFEDDDE